MPITLSQFKVHARNVIEKYLQDARLAYASTTPVYKSFHMQCSIESQKAAMTFWDNLRNCQNLIFARQLIDSCPIVDIKDNLSRKWDECFYEEIKGEYGLRLISEHH